MKCQDVLGLGTGSGGVRRRAINRDRILEVGVLAHFQKWVKCAVLLDSEAFQHSTDLV